MRVIAIGLLLIVPMGALAHGGGLDRNGGHHNRKTGEYLCHREPCFSNGKRARHKPTPKADPPQKRSPEGDQERSRTAKSIHAWSPESGSLWGEREIVMNGPVSTRYMKPNDKLTVVNRLNLYGEPLTTRFQLLLDGKCQTGRGVLRYEIARRRGQGNPEPAQGRPRLKGDEGFDQGRVATEER